MRKLRHDVTSRIDADTRWCRSQSYQELSPWWNRDLECDHGCGARRQILRHVLTTLFAHRATWQSRRRRWARVVFLLFARCELVQNRQTEMKPRDRCLIDCKFTVVITPLTRETEPRHPTHRRSRKMVQLSVGWSGQCVTTDVVKKPLVS